MARRILCVTLTAVLSAACFGTAAADLRKLNGPARMTLERLRAAAPLQALAAEGAAVGPQGALDVFIVGDVSRAQLEAAGVTVRTELPGLVTAFIPLHAIEQVAGLAAVQAIHGAVLAELEHDVSVPATNASTFRSPGPDFNGINGAGVLVGCVDTGVDWTHGDFQHTDGTTRLVAIWDQTVGGTPPAGYAYGNECTAAQIDAATCTQVASDGHGTHTLGTAGGDGSATAAGSAPAFTYAGMAPKADLVMVKTSFSTAALLDGMAYCMGKATLLGMDAAINFSIGSHYGPKDGSSPFEAGMSALTGPGRIICKSAGNERGQLRHAEIFAVNPFAEAQLTLSGSAQGRVIQLAGYYDATETITFTLVSPNGTTIGPLGLGGTSFMSTTNGDVYVENGSTIYGSGAREIFVDIRITNSATQNFNGVWSLRATPVALGAANGEVDFWRFFNSNGTSANFTLAAVGDRELVSEPGNAHEVITVAAWVSKRFWTDCAGGSVNFSGAINPGPIATFSSPGPTRDGRQKPDIAAPGTAIGSARSSFTGTTCPPGPTTVLPGAIHIMNQGTSMASPHATGAAALFLQKYGTQTPDQIRTLMATRAVVDGFTGAVWNKDFGNGKLWLGDMTDPFCTVTAPNGGEVATIGAMLNLTWSASDPYLGVTGVDIELSRDNGATTDVIALNQPNTGTYSWTVTGPATTTALLKVTARDAAGNAGVDLSNAVWEIADPSVSVGPDGDLPAEFALTRISPSPTPGPTVIEYAVPRDAEVSLSVYDLQGREVALLASGFHPAGHHRVTWSGEVGGRAAGAGVYFIRLRGPEATRTQRIVVSR